MAGSDPRRSPAGPADSRKFFFIGGAEGSGTTVLLRLLSIPEGGVSLGGNFIKLPLHPEARPLTRAFDDANKQLWDRTLPFAEHQQARRRWRQTLDDILTSEAFATATRLFFKRSFPFAGPRGQFAPDLWDVLDLRPDARIITIYRDPRAASYSALRRGFDTDLRRIAVVCSEQLTWLAAQVRAIGPERVSSLTYRDLCLDPLKALTPIAAACGIPLEHIKLVLEDQEVMTAADDRWSRELPAEDVAFLDEFFDDRRLRQWKVLSGTA